MTYWRKDSYAPYTCYAAALIILCRNDPAFKVEILAGGHGLLDKHLIENEAAWKEEDLWLKN